jgi:hypothetical protein
VLSPQPQKASFKSSTSAAGKAAVYVVFSKPLTNTKLLANSLQNTDFPKDDALIEAAS